MNVKYRSKSALKLLFQENVTISPGDQTPDWFKFEIDVNKWLLRNKFETMLQVVQVMEERILLQLR